MRDAWAWWEDGQISTSPKDGPRPEAAIPIFEFRTPMGWRVPAEVQWYGATELCSDGGSSIDGKSPEEKVIAMLEAQRELAVSCCIWRLC